VAHAALLACEKRSWRLGLLLFRRMPNDAEKKVFVGAFADAAFGMKSMRSAGR